MLERRILRRDNFFPYLDATKAYVLDTQKGISLLNPNIGALQGAWQKMLVAEYGDILDIEKYPFPVRNFNSLRAPLPITGKGATYERLALAHRMGKLKNFTLRKTGIVLDAESCASPKTIFTNRSLYSKDNAREYIVTIICESDLTVELQVRNLLEEMPSRQAQSSQ